MYAQCFSGNHELIWGPRVAPLDAKKQFPENSRKPMIRLYCFPAAADNYMSHGNLSAQAPKIHVIKKYCPTATWGEIQLAW
jgi:ribosomal protein L33